MRRETKIFFLVLGIVLILLLFRGIIRNNQNSPSNPDIPNEIPNEVPENDLNIPYGSYPKQTFDFYSPENGMNSDTLIIVIHGGAWIAGDKNYMANVAKFFSQQDYSVVNMNYRLAPTWKYDTQLKDITSVISYIDSNRERFKLNSNYKIVLIGHSAGAHLSDLYGVRESYYGGSKNVDYVVSLAGPTDIPVYNSEGEIDRALDAFRGDASKEEISPSRNVPMNERTKFFLLVGTNDNLVSEEQVTLFEQALQEKNAYVETFIVQGKNHNSLFEGIPNNDAVAQRILNFIK